MKTTILRLTAVAALAFLAAPIAATAQRVNVTSVSPRDQAHVVHDRTPHVHERGPVAHRS